MSNLNKLIEKLSEINNSMEEAPWSENALSSGIRHLQRNTDVLENALVYSSDEGNIPGRYDGENLAKLRNLLPEVITYLEDFRKSLLEIRK
jgi:hypothetical protein